MDAPALSMTVTSTTPGACGGTTAMTELSSSEKRISRDSTPPNSTFTPGSHGNPQTSVRLPMFTSHPSNPKVGSIVNGCSRTVRVWRDSSRPLKVKTTLYVPAGTRPTVTRSPNGCGMRMQPPSNTVSMMIVPGVTRTLGNNGMQPSGQPPETTTSMSSDVVGRGGEMLNWPTAQASTGCAARMKRRAESSFFMFMDSV
jgi:hypothetical protein